TLTYTLAANANGAATVTVKLTDDGGGTNESAEQTFGITVNAVNDAPSFTKGADQTADEDSGLHTVAGWATDISKGPADEVGQTLSFVVTNNNNDLFSVQPAIAANGTLTYTLAANANGAATVTVKLTDDGGGTNESAEQTFTVTVNPVNDAPSFTKGADQTVDEDAGAQTVAGWATDISKGPANEAAQTLTFVVANDNNGLFSVQPAIDAAGMLTYTPAADANGSATVTVNLTDNGGTVGGGDNESDAQTFTITVTAVNDAPVGVADEYDVDEDGSLVVAADDGVLANDTDVEDDDLTAVLVADASHGDLTLNANGSFTYTPDANFNGVDTFTYRPNDGTDDGNVTTVTITVNAINDAPVGVADEYEVDEDGELVVNAGDGVLANDADVEDDELTAVLVDGPENGDLTLNADGSFTYTPDADFNGEDTFTYKANDGALDSEVTTVTITVNAVNDAPTVDLLEVVVGGNVVENIERSENITLSATGVSDDLDGEDGEVVSVSFYRDADGDGELDTDVDTLLGTDGDGSDGWTCTDISTTPFAYGENTFFAVATDNDDATTDSALAAETTLSVDPFTWTNGTATVSAYDLDDPFDITKANITVTFGRNNTVSGITLNGTEEMGGLGLVIEGGADSVGNIRDRRRGDLGCLAFIASDSPINSINIKGDIDGFNLNDQTFGGIGFDADVDGDGETNDLTSLFLTSLTGGTSNTVTVGDWLGGDVWAPEGLRTLNTGEADELDIWIGEAENDRLTFNANLGTVEDVDLQSEMPIGSLTVSDWDGGWIEAPSISRLTSKGSFAGEIELLDVYTSRGRDYSLGSMSVKGLIDGADIRTVGTINSITAGGIQNSVIYAGFDFGNDDLDGLTGLPTQDDMNLFVDASINKLTVKGIREDGGLVDSFINSNAAALNMGTVKLSKVQTGNGGDEFGLAANRISKVTFTTDLGTTTRRNPAADLDDDEIDGMVDLLVRMVAIV
ncbi:MAG: Ig-like domain-containing protein, partial [Phycisphaerae bacterium]